MSTTNIHEQFDRLEKPHALSDRVFGVVLGTVLSVAGAIPLLRGGTVRWWALGGAGAVLALALAWPTSLHPLAALWMRIAEFLGKVVNLLTLGVLFFLVITPAGLIRRIFVKDPLQLGTEPEAASYWRTRNPPGPAPEGMVNQF